MIGDFLQNYTYDYFMQLALSFVPDELDKREGSVIYDALAPFCQVLALMAIDVHGFYRDTFAISAEGEALDNRVAEQGLARYTATYAVKRGYFADTDGNPMEVDIGSRFSTVSATSPINYVVTAEYKDDAGNHIPGNYELTCEVSGTIGNEYSGNIININFIQGIATAELGATITPARNEETDDELRARYFAHLSTEAFGGNIADYREKVLSIDGVGTLQIYPVWNGGGTVKLSVLDTDFMPCSEEFLRYLQNEIDPENAEGERGDGLGIAPIGHKVTVVSPETVNIDISASLQLQPGYNLTAVREAIITALTGHLKELRQAWGTGTVYNQYYTAIYLAKISSIIINVPGVVNVYGITVNGNGLDLHLIETGQLQQIPILGEVTLNV